MRVIATELPGVLVVEPVVHGDARGFFVETYHAARYREHGIAAAFVQDNRSKSSINTLHLQLRQPQGKLIQALEGEVLDVAVDVRRGSPTFGRWTGVRLSADNFRQIYVPPGFAHGFCVLSPIAHVEYKCTELYDPASEIGIAWNDPAIGIEWPVRDPLLSARDRGHRTLNELLDSLPRYTEPA